MLFFDRIPAPVPNLGSERCRAGFHSVHFTSKLSVVAKFFFDSQ